MTALIATFSTVHRPLRGGRSARHSSGKRPDAATCSRTRASRGRDQRQPVAPARVGRELRERDRVVVDLDALADASQSIVQPSGPQSTRAAMARFSSARLVPALSAASLHCCGLERLEQLRPVVARDRADLVLGPRLERVRQHVDAQTRPPGVGGHGVGESFELRCHDDDRRLPLGRRPRPCRGRSRRCSEPQLPSPTIAMSTSVGERRRAPRRVRSPSSPMRLPAFHRRTSAPTASSVPLPLVDHPLEANATRGRSGCRRGARRAGPRRAGIGVDVGRWGGRIENLDASHCPPQSRSDRSDRPIGRRPAVWGHAARLSARGRRQPLLRAPRLLHPLHRPGLA